MNGGTEYLRARDIAELTGVRSEPSGAGSPTRSSPPRGSAVHGWWPERSWDACSRPRQRPPMMTRKAPMNNRQNKVDGALS